MHYFSEAAYGLFIHWGLYAIPGGEWEGKSAPHNTEWVMKHLQIPLADYRKLKDQFDPQGFDARTYVRRAKEWGMKYLVFTAKHHDGFAMYDTAVSDYSVMHTPFGRDVVRELADACAEEGLPFGIYYSQMQDWEHPDGNGNTWDYDPAKQDFRNYFYGKVIPQVKELLTNYGKVFLMWFDTPYDMPLALCRELRDTVKACQPDCLINGRIGYGLGDYRQMADNSIPVLAYPKLWEVPMTLNSSWGYSKRDTSCATPQAVLDRLTSINGKGGNLLLNVSPDQNGEIAPEAIKTLDTVGTWLKVNGEAIYGARPAPDFPYGFRRGSITRGEGNTLYMTVSQAGGFYNRVSLTGLETPVTSATLLATGEAVKFSTFYDVARDEHRFYLYLTEEQQALLYPTVRLTLADEPRAQVL